MHKDEGFKTRFQEIVKTSGKDQHEIAALIGCEYNAFRQYTSGRTAMPPRYYLPFCDLFKVSIEWLITGRENPILVAYSALDDNERTIVDKFLFPHLNMLKKSENDLIMPTSGLSRRTKDA